MRHTLKDRRVLGWLMVTGRLRPSPDYLVVGRPYLGEMAARHHRSFHERFAATSAELGFDPTVTRLQRSALTKVVVLAGLTPDRVTQAVIDEGRAVLVAAIGRHRPQGHGPKALSAALFGAQTTLFHLGVLDAPPRKTNRARSAERADEWASIPSRLAATLTGYITQVRLSLRPSTMVRVEGVLREFAPQPTNRLTADPPSESRNVDHLGVSLSGLRYQPDSRGPDTRGWTYPISGSAPSTGKSRQSGGILRAAPLAI